MMVLDACGALYVKMYDMKNQHGAICVFDDYAAVRFTTCITGEWNTKYSTKSAYSYDICM